MSAQATAGACSSHARYHSLGSMGVSARRSGRAPHQPRAATQSHSPEPQIQATNPSQTQRSALPKDPRPKKARAIRTDALDRAQRLRFLVRWSARFARQEPSSGVLLSLALTRVLVSLTAGGRAGRPSQPQLCFFVACLVVRSPSVRSRPFVLQGRQATQHSSPASQSPRSRSSNRRAAFRLNAVAVHDPRPQLIFISPS